MKLEHLLRWVLLALSLLLASGCALSPYVQSPPSCLTETSAVQCARDTRNKFEDGARARSGTAVGMTAFLYPLAGFAAVKGSAAHPNGRQLASIAAAGATALGIGSTLFPLERDGVLLKGAQAIDCALKLYDHLATPGSQPGRNLTAIASTLAPIGSSAISGAVPSVNSPDASAPSLTSIASSLLVGQIAASTLTATKFADAVGADDSVRMASQLLSSTVEAIRAVVNINLKASTADLSKLASTLDKMKMPDAAAGKAQVAAAKVIASSAASASPVGSVERAQALGVVAAAEAIQQTQSQIDASNSCVATLTDN
jgi:hypothetical protein